MSTSTFTQTRSQALNLENQTEALLSKYAKLQKEHNSVNPSEEETDLYSTILDILDKRSDVVNKLNRITESDTNVSTSRLQQLQRHKEKLSQHQQSFHNIESYINEERNRNNLLFSVRSDLDAHRQRTLESHNVPDANNYILDERVRVDNANSFADRLLRQAYNTRDELYNQLHYLNNAQSVMLNTMQSIPGIGTLISKINTRRKRDTFILALVISLCILFLIY